MLGREAGKLPAFHNDRTLNPWAWQAMPTERKSNMEAKPTILERRDTERTEVRRQRPKALASAREGGIKAKPPTTGLSTCLNQFAAASPSGTVRRLKCAASLRVLRALSLPLDVVVARRALARRQQGGRHVHGRGDEGEGHSDEREE